MPDYRIVVEFQHGGLAARESYIFAASTAEQVKQQAYALLNQRIDFLPVAYQLTGVRISNLATRKESQLYLPGQILYVDPKTGPKTLFTNGLYENETESGGIAHIRHTADIEVGWGEGHRATRYFSGVPKAVLRAEPAGLNPTGATQWWGQLDQFMRAITGYPEGYDPLVPRVSVLARTESTAANTPKVKSWSLSNSDPSDLRVTAGFQANPQIDVGDYVHVRGTRLYMILNGVRFPVKASLNGQWKVASVTPPGSAAGDYSYVLHGTAGIQPAWIKKFGTIQKVSSGLRQLNFWAPRKAGIHARGKPQNLPRGRRLTRPLLDP